jgi:hydroxyacylglutathione hydrolase
MKAESKGQATKIRRIGLGGLNCFLLEGPDGFILIDTAVSSMRAKLEGELSNAGCGIGDLRLILLTHGDVDHIGNAAYLREKYKAKIAMHMADAGMAETGDMGIGRKQPADYMSPVFAAMMGLFSHMKTPPLECFTPDIALREGYSLADYGVDARIIEIPGHSKGSIGVLVGESELVCGDLFYNFFGSRGLIHSIFDIDDYRESLSKLAALGRLRLYPGHGKPFEYVAPKG